MFKRVIYKDRQPGHISGVIVSDLTLKELQSKLPLLYPDSIYGADPKKLEAYDLLYKIVHA